MDHRYLAVHTAQLHPEDLEHLAVHTVPEHPEDLEHPYCLADLRDQRVQDFQQDQRDLEDLATLDRPLQQQSQVVLEDQEHLAVHKVPGYLGFPDFPELPDFQ